MSNNTYVVHLVADNQRMNTSAVPIAVLYKGDSKADAESAAMKAFKNPQNSGRWIRFFDFHLFGGGMHDTFVP